MVADRMLASAVVRMLTSFSRENRNAMTTVANTSKPVEAHCLLLGNGTACECAVSAGTEGCQLLFPAIDSTTFSASIAS